MKEVVEEETKKKRSRAVLDFDDKKEKPFTQEDFEAVLKKVTRKIEPADKK